MDNNDFILDRIGEQLEAAAREYDAARTELENIIECFISDIRDNMAFYVSNNIRRGIRKNPRSADSVDDAKTTALAAELKETVSAHLESTLRELRDFRGWRDEDTVFIDSKSRLWKSIKSLEEPVNKVLKKYGLDPIELKNWTWLSIETNELITTRFSESKKNFLDKRKHFGYLQKRHEEETKISGVFDKLDSL